VGPADRCALKAVGRSEQGVAYPQWSVSSRSELGQLALDVDIDRTEEVDVCAGEMWARTSSSMRRPAVRIESKAKP
jgi:hypothetical protein